MSVKTQLRGAAGLLIFVAVVGLTLLWGAIVHGQPASAPASQVVVPLPVGKGWFAANAAWVVPLGIWILANLATALSRYPKANGVVAVLRIFLGGLSMIEFRDGKKPGLALKLPVARPSPPPEEPKA